MRLRRAVATKGALSRPTMQHVRKQIHVYVSSTNRAMGHHPGLERCILSYSNPPSGHGTCSNLNPYQWAQPPRLPNIQSAVPCLSMQWIYTLREEVIKYKLCIVCKQSST